MKIFLGHLRIIIISLLIFVLSRASEFGRLLKLRQFESIATTSIRLLLLTRLLLWLHLLSGTWLLGVR